MPVISVDSDELLEMTKSDQVTLLDVLPKIGIEIEKISGDEWELEVDPDRCDLLSVEGIARAVRGFLEKETGLPEYDIEKLKVTTDVELSVQDVRPYIVTAVVKNVDLSDTALKSLMDLQEKLHLTIGRERSKVAIGVHDFDPIEPPLTYKAVKPKDISFLPLERSMEMNLQEILDKHDKGKEFAHILEDKDKYPVILDSNDDVLSFPPVINGQMTEVTPDTDTFFIDMTGTDMRALEQTLNILTTMLAERGADIYSTEVKYGNRSITYPDFTPEKIDISPSECRKILGTDPDDEDILKILEKMRYSAEKKDDESVEVSIPAYRHDILHPWDVIEDIAIGYDYDNFGGTLPEEVTIGESLPDQELKDSLIELMVGHGFNEVMNYVLTSPKKEFDQMEIEKKENIARVENPVSEESVSLRNWLLPCLLSNLRENRTESLPQKLFEIGDIVRPDEQKTKFAGVIMSADTGFTEMKSILDGLLTNIGFEMTVESKNHASFIEGRCAEVIVSDEEIGYFGEISPEVLENFEIENPVTGFEMDFQKIYEIKNTER